MRAHHEYPSMYLSAVLNAAGALCCVWFLAMSAPALAQTSAVDTPASVAAQPAEEKPPVADDKAAAAEPEPAPAEERPVIAQEKPAAIEEKPAVVEQKPAAVEEKPVVVEQKPAPADTKPAAVEQTAAIPEKAPGADQKPAPAGNKTAIARGKPVARPSRVASRSTGLEHSKPQPARATRKPRERTLVMACTGFRTYNASSGTYRGYDGKTHSCR
jgi:outer membrane biosynthesis protein TonB